MFSFLYYKYQNLDKKVSLNFHAKKLFKIIKQNSDELIIQIEDKENPIPKNFFGKRISNVSGIIGMNGSGKTHIIKTIHSILNFSENIYYDECIMIFEKDNLLYIFQKNLDSKIKIIDQKGNEIYYNYINSIDFEKFFSRWFLFSNVFDGESISEYSNYSKFFVSYSMNDLVLKLSKSEELTYRDQILKNKIINESISLLNNNEYKIIFNDIFKKFPNILVIKFDSGALPFTINHYDSKEQKISKNENENDDSINIDDMTATVNTITYHIQEKLLQIIEKNYEKKLILSIFQNDSFDSLELNQPFQSLIKFQKKLKEIKNQMNEENQEYISITIDYLGKMYKFLSRYTYFERMRNYSYSIDYDFEFEINFDISKEDENTIEDYLFIEKISRELFPFVITEWRFLQKGILSTGEVLQLRIYNFLFSIYSKLNKLEYYNKNKIIIIFDEWDIYLHPKIQVRTFNEINNFINNLFKNFNIQIIFTSNSPFSISDLPNSNINYLGESIEKIENELTFGANIHTLLRNNFFMDSTIGEFSKMKINEAIRILNKPFNSPPEEISKNEKEYLEGLIPIIGEPTIKNKLQAMYLEIYPDEIDEIELIKKLYQEEDISLEDSKKEKIKSKIEAILTKLEKNDD